MNNNQLTESGQLRHFLTIEGLKKPLLTEIMDRAEQFSGITNRQVKKVPILRGKTIVNLFFENSTRTRSTFELAAKRLQLCDQLIFVVLSFVIQHWFPPSVRCGAWPTHV